MLPRYLRYGVVWNTLKNMSKRIKEEKANFKSAKQQVNLKNKWRFMKQKYVVI